MTKVVYVTFNNSSYNSSKRYAYKCPHKVAVGDVAIVSVSGEEKLTTVREIGYDDPMATKFVIAIVDKSKERHEEAIVNRRREIKARLKEIESDIAEQERFAAIAKKSPEAKKLLAEYKRIIR